MKMVSLEGKIHLYPVLCAWCLPKGKRTVLKWIEGCSDSHGICPACMEEMAKKVGEYKENYLP